MASVFSATNKTRSRISGDDRMAFIDFTPRSILPTSRVRYQGSVIGFMGEAMISSGEGSALVIRSLPQGVLIGDAARGEQ
ncbi:MAG: hypothetical protein M2R45_01445 [Verrucomicrobia subdivision 3 bacterium]|nr:hypothetical protein [Limisphaerales bacterium]MCS1417610.1 hypothetical protein [Limisphaerales bacterium]